MKIENNKFYMTQKEFEYEMTDKGTWKFDFSDGKAISVLVQFEEGVVTKLPLVIEG